MTTAAKRSGWVLAACLLIPLVLPACGGTSPPEARISRETFVDTYVALRLAALDSATDSLDASTVAGVLEEQGVSEDDLFQFTDVHSEDLEFMRAIWNDVQLRLDPPESDTAR
jgi:hypothetical protein